MDSPILTRTHRLSHPESRIPNPDSVKRLYFDPVRSIHRLTTLHPCNGSSLTSLSIQINPRYLEPFRVSSAYYSHPSFKFHDILHGIIENAFAWLNIINYGYLGHRARFACVYTRRLD